MIAAVAARRRVGKGAGTALPRGSIRACAVPTIRMMLYVDGGGGRAAKCHAGKVVGAFAHPTEDAR